MLSKAVQQDAPDSARAIAEARARLAPDAEFTIGDGADKVTRSVADVLDDLEAEKGLIDLMETCRIARARK